MAPDQSSPDQPSPARLYATLSGAVLVIGGAIGFFHASTFATPGEVEDALGFAVNGWMNTLHIVVGVLGLFAAGFAARAYSLGSAILFGTLAIWGFALGGDSAILDRFPADDAENLFHALLAVLGLAAFLAERPKRERKPRPGVDPEERRKRDEKKREEKRKRGELRREEKRKRGEEKRDEETRREERRKRDEKRREERRKREAQAADEDDESEESATGAGEDRSSPSESGDDSAARGDEPQTARGPLSRRRRRRRRPPA